MTESGMELFRELFHSIFLQTQGPSGFFLAYDYELPAVSSERNPVLFKWKKTPKKLCLLAETLLGPTVFYPVGLALGDIA